MEALFLSLLGLFGLEEPVIRVDVQVNIEIVVPAEEERNDDLIIRW